MALPHSPLKSVYSNLYDTGKNLIVMGSCAGKSQDLKDDFYESIVLLKLAFLPPCRFKFDTIPDIAIVDGPGATLSFLRLQLGKRTHNSEEFHDACISLGKHITDTYCKSFSISDDERLQAEDIAGEIQRLVDENQGLSLLSNHSSRFRILLLPAEARNVYPGGVCIHSIGDLESGYTIIIPQAIQGKKKKDVLDILIAEIAVCLSDKLVNSYSSDNVNKRSECLECILNSSDSYTSVPPVTICGKGVKRNTEDIQNHLKMVRKAYRPVASMMMHCDEGISQQIRAVLSEIFPARATV